MPDSRSITASTIPGSRIVASSMPMSCSAATASNLDKDARAADLTHRYEELCGHHGMTATRNNSDEAENFDVLVDRCADIAERANAAAKR